MLTATPARPASLELTRQWLTGLDGVIKEQLLASNNVTRRTHIDAQLVLEGVAVGFAGVIDEARAIALHPAIDVEVLA